MNTLRISYYLALTGFFLQFVLLGIGSFDRPDIEINGIYDVFLGLLWTTIKGIPWLVLVPGLLMKSKNVLAWMSYICLVYFIIWMLSAFGAEHSNLATLGVVITLIQFLAAAYYTRLLKRQ
ncbi:MAG: DUF2069 domain-containing protein [Gammaproteobacteria bacterium]|nr:DUF2069 domain-containing protein [Gammaproteobacteria bacterium]